ncbi:hypothetical protein H6F61_20470 [Cyanobacteria bacterium FACHB-472]|nr:hypothetical protein [Cyanobacteria bacterium FACHB-472]
MQFLSLLAKVSLPLKVRLINTPWRAECGVLNYVLIMRSLIFIPMPIKYHQ